MLVVTSGTTEGRANPNCSGAESESREMVFKAKVLKLEQYKIKDN
jgi:hypothetical protein